MSVKLKQHWGLIFLFSLVFFLLSGCSSPQPQPKTWKDDPDQQVKGQIKLWVDSDLVSAYMPIVQNYQKQYPEVKIKVTAHDSNHIQKLVAQDPTQAADVFLMNNVEVGSMADNGLLYPLQDQREQKIKATQVNYAAAAVTYHDNLYGYPTAIEAPLLYYDQDQLKGAEVKKWSTLTETATVAANFDQPDAHLVFTPLFYRDSSALTKRTIVDIPEGKAALNWIAAQKNRPHVLTMAQPILPKLKKRQLQAVIASSRQYSPIKTVLGSDLGVTVLPELDFKTQPKMLKSLLLVKLWGVNQQTKYPLAAMTLAAYLGSKDTQLQLFEAKGIIPTEKSAQKDEKVATNPPAKQVFQSVKDSRSILIPNNLNEFDFWTNMDQLLKETYQGKLKSEDYAAKIIEINQETKSK